MSFKVFFFCVFLFCFVLFVLNIWSLMGASPLAFPSLVTVLNVARF